MMDDIAQEKIDCSKCSEKTLVGGRLTSERWFCDKCYHEIGNTMFPFWPRTWSYRILPKRARQMMRYHRWAVRKYGADKA